MSKEKVKGRIKVFTAIEVIARKHKGKILTVIDASISDKQQNKAIKDLLNQVMSEMWNDPLWEAVEEAWWEEGDAPDSIKDFLHLENVGSGETKN